ncbi:MAG: hypothetical protein ABJC98_17955, partial [Bacteroidota bacterium]
HIRSKPCLDLLVKCKIIINKKQKMTAGRQFQAGRDPLTNISLLLKKGKNLDSREGRINFVENHLKN